MGVNNNKRVVCCYLHLQLNSLPFQEIGKHSVHLNGKYKLTELKERETDNGWNLNLNEIK